MILRHAMNLGLPEIAETQASRQWFCISDEERRFTGNPDVSVERARDLHVGPLARDAFPPLPGLQSGREILQLQST